VESGINVNSKEAKLRVESWKKWNERQKMPCHSGESRNPF